MNTNSRSVTTCTAMNLLSCCMGVKPWPFTSREEHRLRVFESRVLKRMFGPKRDEMKGGLGKSCQLCLDNVLYLSEYSKIDIRQQ
jgi:hypothetical protein